MRKDTTPQRPDPAFLGVAPAQSRPRAQRAWRPQHRDLAALRWIGEQQVVRLDQLQVLLARLSQRATPLGVQGAVDELCRWERAGLVQLAESPVASLIEEPARARTSGLLLQLPERRWALLTHQGRRFVGLPSAPSVAEEDFAHAFFVAHLRLAFEAEQPDCQWQPGWLGGADRRRSAVAPPTSTADDPLLPNQLVAPDAQVRETRADGTRAPLPTAIWVANEPSVPDAFPQTLLTATGSIGHRYDSVLLAVLVRKDARGIQPGPVFEAFAPLFERIARFLPPEARSHFQLRHLIRGAP